MHRNAVGFCVVACLMLVGLSRPAWGFFKHQRQGLPGWQTRRARAWRLPSLPQLRYSAANASMTFFDGHLLLYLY